MSAQLSVPLLAKVCVKHPTFRISVFICYHSVCVRVYW